MRLFRRRSPRYCLALTNKIRTMHFVTTQFRNEDEARQWCKSVNGAIGVLDPQVNVTFTYEKID